MDPCVAANRIPMKRLALFSSRLLPALAMAACSKYSSPQEGVQNGRFYAAAAMAASVFVRILSNDLAVQAKG
jgi:hypothetical protein